MRKSSSKRRNRFRRRNTGRFNKTIHLYSTHSKIVNKRMTSRDEIGTLLNYSSSRCLVCCVNDQSEVFRSHECGASGADEIESVREPSVGSS